METIQKSSDSSSSSAFKGLWQRWLNKRSRDRARAMSRVRFRLTREGVHFIGVLLFIFLGALLRDINLLILLAGAMVGLMLLQWRFNTRSLIGLTADRFLPHNAFVGSEVSVEVCVSNPKRWLGTWLVVIEDPLRKLMPSVERLSEKGTALIEEVPPGGGSSVGYQLTFHQRGCYAIGPTTLSTRFPLSLGRGSRTLDNQVQFTVFPKLVQLSAKVHKLFQQEQQGSAQAARTVGLQEGDFYGLRPWSTGDSKRWIHWRTTARQGELSVRQFERCQRERVCVLLDLHGQPQRRNGPSEHVEAAVSFLASLAHASMRRGSEHLAVGVAASESFVLPSIQGGVLVGNLLRRLAVVEPSLQPDLVATLQGLSVPLLNNPYLLVISTRSDQSKSLRDHLHRQTASRLRTRLQIHWLNATQGDLDSYFS